jgi:hypothetical protein
MKGNLWKGKRLGVVAMLVIAVAAVAVVCLQGVAFGDEQVNTGAIVTTSNVPPNIECKWELPDMQSGVVGDEYPDPTIQYRIWDPVNQVWLYDDDMNVVPDADNDPTNGIQVPCSGPPATVPTMPQNVRHMIQVMPNPEDNPEERWIQLWAAVDHPHSLDAITDVFWDVYHPDGTPKGQWHYEGVITGSAVDCAALGSSVGDDTMFQAAYETGQVTAEAIDDINKGMIAKCQESEKAIYYAKFPLSKHQPCGEYRVELHAVSGGAETVLVNYIDVICMFNMEIDFDGVDWGDITAGLKDVVSGDLIFDPTEIPSAPTVKNTGNSGMQVGVHFSEMLQQGVALPKKITLFDACFGKSPAGIQCFDPINASETVWFGEVDDPDRILCSNEIGKLDLSIHPPSSLPAGTYAGDLDVMARAMPSPRVCPTDQGHIEP